MLFRELDAVETIQFHEWARKNYQVLTPINPLWHPTVQSECHQMNMEHLQARRYTKKISSKPGYAVGSYVSPASAATGVFIGDRLVAIVQNVTGAAGFWTVSTPDGTTLASGLATKASAIKRAWDEIDA